MIVVGLTGPSGSGKTLLCSLARSLDCETINADEVYHSLLVPPSKCLDEIVSTFGDVLLPNGFLDRKRLGQIVFSDSKKLDMLNSVTHKYVKNEFRSIISKMRDSGTNVVIVDAPTLFESGFDKECDVTVCLLATEELRRQRIIIRDDLDCERADARLSSQKGDDFFTDRVNHVIYNNGTESDLKHRLTELLDIITKESYKHEQHKTQ